MDMGAILRSATRLLEMAGGTHPHPDALGRLRRVLGATAAHCISNPTFTDSFKQMLDNFVGNFSNDTRKVDNLTTRLQATRSPKGCRHGVSPTAQLAGLHGNDLFRALMALQLPVTAPPEFCLEAALAAQSLIVHDHLDLFIHLCEEATFKGDSTVVDEFNFMVFMDHINTLEKFMQEHIDLANAAATSRATTGQAK
ncbi:uncharacterized protein [Aegilops tauschii subsp. strangulata]|uniref:uncharacterized protein n=1 Tax=Aegilops tauschii subsp. strangulata TaxID=200361 RepID=UPI0008424FE4|nr:uncharacterized protein LOC109782071 [Aegilops tauschii subsp. strangulata]XP_040246708.1 uncharacterized protein LOC109782071 [Aegilops tauschii subsp. strangulata]XP_044398619.1 uncharacterized protein LOC123122483 [Triticum aestivum]XP_045085055.1 uncharacterized protein LOC109782071 [Aegilops tauschii subsp. strangulata]XP_045085056.1 uncharacterized protein LOC109782071 [Aegilops tauschii subsp. strangulata]